MTMPSFSQDNLEWLSPIEIKNPIVTESLVVKGEVCIPCNCDSDALKARVTLLEERMGILWGAYQKVLQKASQAPPAQPAPKVAPVPVVPKVEPVAVTKGSITMYTSKRCPPCESWKRVEYPKFLASKKWNVTIETSTNGLPTPNYVVKSPDGSITTYVGYLPFEIIN